ncbi:bifunctional UDP-N-acetylmuramoyl-tripeptide:D-alanyl-D-alanine ligase/alanine racemase [Flavobacterium sp. JP2137]|uniref:bifunctional UDP-N-acetylmuramoyl-tripeptide:D-alanyl-D-alanine ligase/alanine racemase n=1 Tax=Flavobacterium sp. JP2137 TaxID=3414510 RepID=UPI003D2FEC6C
MKIKVSDFCKIVSAKTLAGVAEIVFTHVSIDSRSLQNNEHSLFFALDGAHHDAHQFIGDLIQKGVRNFVVSKEPLVAPEGVHFFRVDNTLIAFQKFAAYYRAQFDFPVIGITGSRGKTVVKEWLNFLLNPDHNVIKSPKSYNSQVGVPLSVLGIDHKHNFGIFEAGISTVNEMETLQTIIQPTLGILTAIGSDHDEGFENLTEKITEKLRLFKGVSKLILEEDAAVLQHLKNRSLLYTWSFIQPTADVFFIHKQSGQLTVNYGDRAFEVDIPFEEPADLANIATCITTLLWLEYSEALIAQRLSKLYRVEMRLQVKNGIHQCTLIDDSYSSDFQSLKIALDFLEKHKTHTDKTVILSDVFQSGLPEVELYRQVGALLQSNKINRIIGIGPAISKQLQGLKNFYGYSSTDAFLQKFAADEFQQETILVKGARGFQFQKICSLLEEKTHETVLEINLNAVRHNLNFYRSKLRPSTKVMVMVKAFGYGNGSFEIAKLLAHDKIDYLGVAFADEGIALRKAGIQLPIIVMNPEISAFSAMIAYDLEPEIYSIRELKAFLQFAQEKNAYQYPIHIKLDTGMHRLGFEDHNLDELIAVLKPTNVLEVKTIFSHLSSSDMAEYRAFTLDQIALFVQQCSRLTEALEIDPIRHILNTSGIYHFPEHQLEMVRLGIGLYGVGNDVEETKQLAHVSTLRTVILQLRRVSDGESVGYARRFRSKGVTKIATIPIGYADGIPRAWGNEKGYVYIKECKATIVGSICMDMMMVDVSGIECEEGDSVIVFGPEIPVTEVARQLNTIPYEIMTSISQRVKRIFYEE